MSNYLNILLVEDDDDDVALTVEYLDEAYGRNYSLDHAASLPEARQAARKGGYDVYLVDFSLGAEDGIDFVREVTGMLSVMKPVILLTGQDDRDTDIRAMNAGATDYLLKQFITAQSLERSIRYSINQKNAEMEIQLLADSAREANKAKSSFLAVMSHELRTPLNAISGFSEMLSSEVFGPLGSDKYKEYATDIHTSSSHLLSLINDILDLSAIEQGQLSLTKESISVPELIDEVSHIISAAALQKGVHYSTNISPDLAPLVADRRAMKQIFLNILGNAIKFTPEGGTMTFNVSVSDKMYVFELSDTGIGVTPDLVSRLTDPFFRVQTDPYRAQDGAGLGLSIVKSIVSLHDGRLTIDSNEGAGMTIIVTLPVVDTPPTGLVGFKG